MSIKKDTCSSKKIRKSMKKNTTEGDTFDESENSKSIRKIELVSENTSMASQASTFSKDYSSIGINNKKKEKDFLKKSGFIKLRNIIFISIFIIFLLVIIEISICTNLKNENYNENQLYFKLREFIRIYYKLFTSMLGVACIPESLNSTYCENYLEIFKSYLEKRLGDSIFDITMYVLNQNDILVNKLMDIKDILPNLANLIGEEKYEKIVGKNMSYIDIGKKNILNSTKLELYKN